VQEARSFCPHEHYPGKIPSDTEVCIQQEKLGVQLVTSHLLGSHPDVTVGYQANSAIRKHMNSLGKVCSESSRRLSKQFIGTPRGNVVRECQHVSHTAWTANNHVQTESYKTVQHSSSQSSGKVVSHRGTYLHYIIIIQA
jgi:hypothetical protein